MGKVKAAASEFLITEESLIIGILALASFRQGFLRTAAPFANSTIIGTVTGLEHVTFNILARFIDSEGIHREILAHRRCLRKD